jgi:hypothetical protein
MLLDQQSCYNDGMAPPRYLDVDPRILHLPTSSSPANIEIVRC